MWYLCVLIGSQFAIVDTTRSVDDPDISVSVLIRRLGVKAKRINAIRQLGEMYGQAKTAVPALKSLLESDKDGFIKWYAASAIWKITENKDLVVPTLMKMLANRGEGLYAALAIAEIGSPARETIPALLQLLQHDPCSTVRELAAAALGSMGGDARTAVPALLDSLGDESALVTIAASKAVVVIRPQSVDQVLAVLNNKNPIIRQAGVQILGQLRVPKESVITALVQIAKTDSDSAVKARAREALRVLRMLP